MKLLFTFIFTLLGITFLFAETKKDTIYTLFSETPVVIDGSDADPIWAKATWHSMDQVWIPYNQVMAEGDFEGKYKVAWDKNYLYVLVHVVDDSLSDDHEDPLDNYWNDDAVEIFVDEDHSGGNHQNNNSAFAYHCSIFYDVIDGAGVNGATINCKNNIIMKMDTIDEHTYLWEFAVKIYDKSFVYSKPDPSKVALSPNKLMGFSIAYCDNDATTSRENFIGSVYITEAHANDSYINSDYFGTMLLVDPDKQFVSSAAMPKEEKKFSIYPNPVKNRVNIECNESLSSLASVEILSLDGKIVSTIPIHSQRQSIDLNELSNGLYMVKIKAGNYLQSEKLMVQ
jgi:hypothetical protein